MASLRLAMGIWTSIKQFFKDSVVGATSTHGGVAGGTSAASKQRRKKKRDESAG
jgi:hypothetical protein